MCEVTEHKETQLHNYGERRKERDGRREIWRGDTHSIRDEAGSLDTSRLYCLEEVDHTLHLESLQLRVETDECPCPPHSITERVWEGRKILL